ncbi:hypothetical protein AAG570_011774 [Ranatra chinensis]|uniref:Yellow-e n=1 Tax=Ranatra chinensis TaxID=642074 RepID=A0ABD0YZ93_9HEMI
MGVLKWIGALVVLVGFAGGELEVVYEWPLLTYQQAPHNYPTNQDFTPERTVFTGVEVGWDRIYLATPRIWSGNPATLAVLPRPKNGYPRDSSPQLQPYPSWEWHADSVAGDPQRSNCSGLVSVFRIRADRCNRLWVLDSGVLDSLVTFTIACPPRLLVFDMATDRLVRSITLPQEVLRRNTLLTNLVIDEPEDGLNRSPSLESCDSAFVYMSDSTNPGLIVYDSKRDAAWRLSHPQMFPDPDFGTYRVAGESFTLMDGIIGLTLSGAGVHPKRLFFQPFASDRLLSVETSVLQRGPNPGDDSELPVALVGYKSSQAAGLAVDPRDGAVVFSPVSETAIASWIPGSPNHRVVAYNPELLQFTLDFRSADRDSGVIWFLTTKFQKIFRRTLDQNDMNLRIMRIVEPNNYFNNTLFLYKKK